MNSTSLHHTEKSPQSRNLMFVAVVAALQITATAIAATSPPAKVNLCVMDAEGNCVQTTTPVDALSTADEIRIEATRSNNDPGGRPLPLFTHWVTGTTSNPDYSAGWRPDRQLDRIERGHHLLPVFNMPGYGDTDYSKLYAFSLSEFEIAVKRARDLRLPLVFLGTQWEWLLYRKEEFLNLSPELNPNVVTPAADVLSTVSPFGAIEPWREVGQEWIQGNFLELIQQWYPNPPSVMFVSNNEASKLRWPDVENSSRYLNSHGLNRDSNFKRTVVSEGRIERYGAMFAAMHGALVAPDWKINTRFVGYSAFGPRHLGRWGGWTTYSLAITGRIDPSPLIWGGGSTPFYLNSWEPVTDFTVYSPQVELMNLVFMREEALRLNPEFWHEISVWDGSRAHDDTKSGKREYFESLGQSYSPERYVGAVQYSMWNLRPRAVREYRDHTHPWEDAEPYYMALLGAVDKIYENPILTQWWRRGELVSVPRKHPYQAGIPEEYADEDRWFLLDADVNSDHAIYMKDIKAEIKVYSLALVQGASPNRQWLIYAHSPLANRGGVGVTVPDFGTIKVDVPVGGAFYLVDENTKAVRAIR